MINANNTTNTTDTDDEFTNDHPAIRQLKREITESFADKLWGNDPDIKILDNKGSIHIGATKRIYGFLEKSDYKRLLWRMEKKLSARGSHAAMIDVYNNEPRLATALISIRPSFLYRDLYNIGTLKESYELFGAKLRLYENYGKWQNIDDSGNAIGKPEVGIRRTASLQFSGGVEGTRFNKNTERELNNELKKVEIAQEAQFGVPSGFVFPEGWLKNETYRNLDIVPAWEFTNKSDRLNDFKELDFYFAKYVSELKALGNELKKNITRYIFMSDQIPAGDIEAATDVQKQILEGNDIWMVSAIRNWSGGNNSGLPWEIFKGDPKLDIYWLNAMKTRNFILNVAGALDSASMSGGINNKTTSELALSKERNHHILENKLRQRQSDLRRLVDIMIKVDIDTLGNGDKYPEDWNTSVKLHLVDAMSDVSDVEKITSLLEKGLISRAEGRQMIFKQPSYLAEQEMDGINKKMFEDFEKYNIVVQGFADGMSMRVEQEENEKDRNQDIKDKGSKVGATASTGADASNILKLNKR